MDNFPFELRELIHEYQFISEPVGWSGARVYRLQHDFQRPLYLKIQSHTTQSASLYDETQRIKWLSGIMPVPELLYYGVNNENEYMLTVAMEGKMCHEWEDRSEAIKLFAHGLKLIHSVDIQQCPFSSPIDMQQQKVRNVVINHIQNNELSKIWEANPSWGKSEILTKGELQDIVLLHGDYSLPNVLLLRKDSKETVISGFVDLGRCGKGDRFSDLAQAACSIEYNFGREWIGIFFHEYGVNNIN